MLIQILTSTKGTSKSEKNLPFIWSLFDVRISLLVHLGASVTQYPDKNTQPKQFLKHLIQNFTQIDIKFQFINVLLVDITITESTLLLQRLFRRA